MSYKSINNYKGYINNHLADEHSPFMVDDKPLIDYKIVDLDDHMMDKILKTLKRTKHNVSATTIVHIYSVFKGAITHIYNENRKHFDINPSESKKAKISRPKKQVWCPNKELAREVLKAVDSMGKKQVKLKARLLINGKQNNAKNLPKLLEIHANRVIKGTGNLTLKIHLD